MTWTKAFGKCAVNSTPNASANVTRQKEIMPTDTPESPLPTTEQVEAWQNLCNETASELLACAVTWDSDVRLVGNVRAADIAALCRSVPSLIEKARANDALREDLAESNRCPWCHGTGSVTLGGYPDVNGHLPEGPCPCEDCTIVGAFNSLTKSNAELRAKLAEAEAELDEFGAGIFHDWLGVADGVKQLARCLAETRMSWNRDVEVANEALAALREENARLTQRITDMEFTAEDRAARIKERSDV